MLRPEVAPGIQMGDFMLFNKENGRRVSVLLIAALAGSSFLNAADDATRTVAPAQSQNDEITALKAALAAQQKQLEALQATMAKQQELLQKAVTAQTPRPASLGNVASTTPYIPVAPVPAMAIPAAQAPKPAAAASASKNPCEAGPDNVVPPYIRLGSVCAIPIGFMDLTSVWRNENAASSIGSNFGSVPFSTAVPAGKLSEFRFSPQNSRIGFRIDGDWKGAHFIGYNEFDFLGTSGSTNLTVTNGAFVPRLRLFWVDVRKDKWEFLAGQSWSMLTPNRKGISALPGDLFYSQVIDVNYMIGLTWTRQPGMRFLYHPNKQVTFGFSAENPDQYMGGSAGGSASVLPAALTGLSTSQLDNGTNIGTFNPTLAIPSVHPDFIAKVAFDPSSRLHAEVAGIFRTFKDINPLAAPAAGAGKTSTKNGAGIQFGFNAEVVKNIRLVSTNYWSDGGGRYLFGQAPDVVVRADGSLSPVHAAGTVDGIEATIKNTLLYTYYGGIYVGRNVVLDANGTSKVGYGFTGSSQNRAINEFTVGFNQTLWKNPRYGAINFMGQYEYLQRNPWSVAPGALSNAHDHTIYTNIRYTLPGSMPNF